MSMSMSGGPSRAGDRKTLEHQLVDHRIDCGDTESVPDRGVGRQSPALAQDVVLPAEPGDIVNHQKVVRKGQMRNDFQLPLDLGVRTRRALGRPVAFPRARHRQLPQPAVLGVDGGHVERRQSRRDQRQPERTLLAEFDGGGHHIRVPKGHMPEQPGHLRTGPQVRAAQQGQPSGGQRLPGPDRTHRHGQPAPRRLREMRPGGGDDPDPEAPRDPGQHRVAFIVEGAGHAGSARR